MLKQNAIALVVAAFWGILGVVPEGFAQSSYVPLRTQVYGGTYATPAYTQVVATASARPPASYDHFSKVFREWYPNRTNILGLDEFMYSRLGKPWSRAIEIGRYAEERFVGQNSEWRLVENRYHPEYDLYRVSNGKIEYAQMKTHDPANYSGQEIFARYLSDLRSDRKAALFLIPDDHVEGVLRTLEAQRQAAIRQGNDADAVFLSSQRERIKPMGVTYSTLVSESAEAQRLARKRIISQRIGYTFTAVVVVLPVGYDTYRWWNGDLSGSALAYSGEKSGTILLVGLGTSKIVSQHVAFRASPWKTTVVVAVAVSTAQQGFLIYEYGGLENAVHQRGFLIETGGNIGALALCVPGTIVGTTIGFSIGGPPGAFVGGLVIGGGATILGDYAGRHLTALLLDTLDPEFYHRMRIDQTDRAIDFHRNAVKKMETSAN